MLASRLSHKLRLQSQPVESRKVKVKKIVNDRRQAIDGRVEVASLAITPMACSYQL
ncbi:MAG: hypothetical protein OEW48_08320 [Phycisphaerae bacterium]|nr:hypothetical protein [Phycisphaerae bacterium]